MTRVERLSVEIQGAVQGVGFRPFVYRLASELSLAGWVINDSQGVFIEVEGPRPVLESFLQRLPSERPPRALIQEIASKWLAPAGYDSFEIRHSDSNGAKTVLMLPDIATCPDCLAEVLDPANRRYRYPFTNCTNCGPRFSIIQELPYDRPNTTMRRFTMCPECQCEYGSPLDRRFHAQPNACPVCGPRLTLYRNPRSVFNEDDEDDVERRPVTTRVTVRPSPAFEGDAALTEAAKALRHGDIVAVKGLGGFLLMVDAGNGPAVLRLRMRKPRRDKAFAVMACDLEQVGTFCKVAPEAAELLSSAEAPIVLLPAIRAPGHTPPDSGRAIAPEVAPGNPNLGVMLPYTPLHHLLLREIDFPVVATSGNLTDEPICTDEWEAFERLGHIADAFLVHDRPIERHVDDSVVWIVRDQPQILRRARGYAPLPVRLREPVPVILAVGAHLKNTIALSVGRHTFISQHIGDLETAEALAAFERVIADFQRMYDARPAAIAHDLHPDYVSTRWAGEQDNFLVPVQHHHAHLAACLAENQAEGPALGVTWDGTGYGIDGTIWGGEFLSGDATGFERVAHLRPFRLPGGDAASHEPRRAALALLWELYGDNAFEREDLAPVRAFRPVERDVLGRMLRSGTNSPITTSAGRLFDGVASLLGFEQRVSFEGQAAMSLEFAADAAERGAYPMSLVSKGGENVTVAKDPGAPSAPDRAPLLVLDWGPMLEALLSDLQRAVPAGIMAARFHNALAAAIVDVAKLVGERRVALTGGCFQNRMLVERSADGLGQAGFEVLLHRVVPPNDGGISLGQIAVASARLSKMAGA